MSLAKSNNAIRTVLNASLKINFVIIRVISITDEVFSKDLLQSYSDNGNLVEMNLENFDFDNRSNIRFGINLSASS